MSVQLTLCSRFVGQLSDLTKILTLEDMAGAQYQEALVLLKKQIHLY